MNDLLDITDKIIPVAVAEVGAPTPIDAGTDDQHFYFDEEWLFTVTRPHSPRSAALTHLWSPS